MEKAKVYFTNLRTKNNDNLQQKLERLIRKAGIGDIDFDGKYTAIKIHFGEPGNLAYLRPNYAKTVADYVKELGGKPFLTDANLYFGFSSSCCIHNCQNPWRHKDPGKDIRHEHLRLYKAPFRAEQ